MKTAQKKKVAAASNGNGTGTPVLDANKVARIAAKAAAQAVGATLTGVINRQTNILAGVLTKLDSLEIASATVAAKREEEEDDEEATAMVPPMTTKKVAAKREEEDEDDEEACQDDEDASAVNARGKSKSNDDDDDDDEDDDQDDGDDDDDDDMESMATGDVSQGDLEDMGPDPATDEDVNDKPGAINENATNKGDKTTSEDKTGPSVNKGITGARFKALMKETKKLAAQVSTLMQANKGLQADNKKLRREFDKVNNQVVRASTETTRRSLTPEIQGLLSKGGLDPVEMTASGTKMTALEFDAILASAGVSLDNLTRIRLKGDMVRAGLMDEGKVDRNYRR